ncbi:MAG: glycosyltransferase [Paludibacteraceae bacterium]
MQVLFFISCVILLLYVAMIVSFWVGWRRTPWFDLPEVELHSLPKVSLVVCCRNEEQNLPALLHSIELQKYSSFEVIFSDDHSTDRTSELLALYAARHQNVRIVSPEKSGKKYALQKAVECAAGELVCCTDADCVLHENHLLRFAEYYAVTQSDLILGGVRLLHSDSLFEKLQALEFLSLQASTAGAAGIGCPVMCNGANLAFRKEVWQTSVDCLREETPSGDDVFFLQSLKKRGGSIRFLKNAETIVTTSACSTPKAFFAQRTRWTSKTAYYTDLQTILVASLVLCSVVVVVFWAVAAFFLIANAYAFLAFFFLKFLIDTLFVGDVLPFFGERKLRGYTFLLSLVYPFYVLTSAVGGFIGTKTWKNRKFR